MENPVWLAAHLYYAEPWETFLMQAVQPFAESVLQEQLSDQYFFIRYWEKGPHIRLRFRGTASRLERVVKPRLMAHFRDYYHQHPSRRTEPVWLAQLPDGQTWYPDNTVQFIAYEPETDRYGGEQGVMIAEQQFFASSRAVLNAIATSKHWNYERSLGVGIQLHLGMLYQMGLSRSEACQFLQLVFAHWLPRAYFQGGETLTQATLRQRRDEVLWAFSRSYTRQRDQLLPMMAALWEGLEQKADFSQRWFQQWMYDMQEVRKQIEQFQTDNLLEQPSHCMVNPALAVSPDHQVRWAIYESYVHMTNNRLGILNRDEGYLGYLLWKALQEI